ncbi:MAG TPA: flavodoxin domain-containing protein [Acidimicrobiales bacterium]|nr:flavodoxin domain-containing protein [Acidimicrobiales bacterium]
MKAVVIYESLTGNTRRAAGQIGTLLEASGVATKVMPITDIDYQALGDADLVIVGTWTDGLVLFGQRPGRAGRLRSMPFVAGKRCAVYVTYAIDQGRALEKLAAILEDRGADVIGGMAIRRDNIPEGCADFVARILDVVAA